MGYTGFYYKIPKAIFYLRKGDYIITAISASITTTAIISILISIILTSIFPTIENNIVWDDLVVFLLDPAVACIYSDCVLKEGNSST